MSNQGAKEKGSILFESRIVGDESTPVISCDNVIANLGGFLEETYEHVSFSSEATTYYPGLRAPLPKRYTAHIINLVYSKIVEVFDIDSAKKIKINSAFYSFVSKPESDLSVLQRVPHFDKTEKFSFAIMHYLNPGSFGGTGFFRHKPTNFERISTARKKRYFDTLKFFFDENGEPDSSYISSSDGHFELISSIQYKANRLIIYPANLLHSGLINPDQDIHINPRHSRLTANIFLEFV